MLHTKLADLGLTLDKDTNMNYRLSLPNKLFDYIHAGIPVLSSDLVEVRNIIEKYDVGDVCSSHEPKMIADKISEMLSSDKNRVWKENCKKAKIELNWETESKVLAKIIDSDG